MALAQIIPFRPSQATRVESIASGQRASEFAQSSKDESGRVEKLISSDKTILDSDKKIIQSQDKLRTNLEKLVKAISESAKANGKLTAGGRAEEFASGKMGANQKIDYRSTKTMIKEGISGRGGNKFDPNSLKYKFGTLRGLASTTGLVSRGDGGFADNLLARREERQQGSDTLQKLNPQMKNLKQFKGDQKNVKKFYDNKMKAAQEEKRKLQEEQDKLDTLRASGMDDEEIARTTGGGRQINKRNKAFAKVLDVDSRLRGEKNATMDEGSKLFAMGNAANANSEPKTETTGGDLNENQLESIKMQEGQSATFVELLDVTKAEAARKTEADAALLMAIKGIEIPEGEGGGLGSMVDTASNLAGKGKGKPGGKAGKIGKLAKLGKFAGRLAGPAVAVGMGAYEAYSGFNDAEAEVKAGTITKDEGDVKKSAAIGKGAGGAGGALAGAAAGAAIGSVVPIVGTAIGGLIGGGLGYFGGSSAGEAVGEYGAKAYKSVFGGSDKPAEKNLKPGSLTGTSGKGNAQSVKPNTSDAVKNKSIDNDMNKMQSQTKGAPTIINAPTNNVSKQTQNNMLKTPVRDQDNSLQSYYRSKYA